MAMKLDMEKAYDRLEWSFVETMLISMGFPIPLVNTILSYISTVMYQVFINGHPSRVFSPKRGRCQGDPLSPYLFILCANVLYGFLKCERNKQNLCGIQVARSAPKITHLLFADDSLLVARANLTEADTIMQVLQSYQSASG